MKLISSGQIALESGAGINALGNIILQAQGGGSALGIARGNGNVAISGGGKVQASSAWVGVRLSGANIISVVPGNLVKIDPGTSGVGIIMNGATVQSGSVAWSEETETEEAEMKPVAFVSMCRNDGAFGENQYLAETNKCLLYATKVPRMSATASGVLLNEGCVLLSSRSKTLVLDLGSVKLNVRSEALVEVERSGGSITIRNFADRSAKSVSAVTITGRTVIINPGEQLSIGVSKWSDELPRRREVDLGGMFEAPANICEISMSHVISYNDRVHLMARCDKHDFDNLLRTAACLQVIQSTHGRYRK